MKKRGFLVEGRLGTLGLSPLEKTEIAVQRANPETTMNLRFEVSDPEVIQKLLSVEDLTLLTQEGARNIAGLVFDDLLDQLGKDEFPNIRVIRNNPVVPASENFAGLLFPEGNAGQSSTYTRWVDKKNVLRTHTSAMIPQTLAKLNKGKLPSEITMVMPGLVYRRDVIDKSHLDVFHQVDVWTLKENKGSKPATRKDLLALVQTVFDAACPGAKMEVLEANHPYTVDGIEVYANIGGQRIEVLEAGLIHPQVLKNAGIDPRKYSGLALGMGLERLIMARKGLPDIRLIRSENPKVLKQMDNMKPYREVSNQPAKKRDMSYMQPVGLQEEDVCENIRIAFADNAYLIEEVEIISRTSYDELVEQFGKKNPQVLERLGAQAGQENILVRVILRHPDRTISKKEGGAMYNEAYPKLHKGTTKGHTVT